MIGVSVRTLQRWDNEGTLPAHRNPKQRRYYTQQQYDEYRAATALKKKAVYARAENEQEVQSLVERLRGYAKENGVAITADYTDITGREQWYALINDCAGGQISAVVVHSGDSFVQEGLDGFKQLLQANGVELYTLNGD